MNLHREDVYCPACPDPEKAFRIEDVGMKLGTEDDRHGDDTFRITASRPLWEPLMLEHLRLTPDEPHRRLHADCVALLAEQGQTAEENARAALQDVVDGARRSMDETLRPVDEPFPSAFKVNGLAVAPEMTAWLNRERPAR